MKHQQTDKFFRIPLPEKNGSSIIVQPMNGEKDPRVKKAYGQYDISWSHGKTHFQDVATGRIGHCGIQWFEDHAAEAADPARKPKQKPPAPF